MQRSDRGVAQRKLSFTVDGKTFIGIAGATGAEDGEAEWVRAASGGRVTPLGSGADGGCYRDRGLGCGSSSGVERLPSKQDAVGSNPISRSNAPTPQCSWARWCKQRSRPTRRGRALRSRGHAFESIGSSCEVIRLALAAPKPEPGTISP